MEKFIAVYYWLRLFIFTALAVLIGVFAHQLIEYLPFLVGGVIVIYGFEGVLFPISRVKGKFFHEYQFFLGLVQLLLGILMMAKVRDFNNICMIWATWTIVRESFELYETTHKFLKKFPAILSLSLSMIEIVFSVLLIIYATEHHALTHIYLLIPEFVINGLSPLLFIYYSKHILKKSEPINE